jgi:hypothetical protein
MSLDLKRLEATFEELRPTKEDEENSAWHGMMHEAELLVANGRTRWATHRRREA